MTKVTDNSGFFLRNFPHRCIQSAVVWINDSSYVHFQEHSQNICPLSRIDPVSSGLQHRWGVLQCFCIAALKMLSPEHTPVGLVSHFLHSLFACKIPHTSKQKLKNCVNFLFAILYLLKKTQCANCWQAEWGNTSTHQKLLQVFLGMVTSSAHGVTPLLMGHRCSQSARERARIPAACHSGHTHRNRSV